ncbi:MAG TPA: cation diffusion facilitator family transporter [Patescibacteria group bacterium]|nr:cation diffusion facilitator family transporter [Patescibacteria group bacterium]
MVILKVGFCYNKAMSMNIQERSLWVSVAANIFLSIIKLIAGFFSRSSALIADGLHSGLDIFSSLVALVGVKVARREQDEKHPYGFYTVETVASFLIVLLIFGSGVWIIYEGGLQIINRQAVDLGIWGFVVIFISVVVNELIARYKIRVGEQENSLALVMDGKHSRADVLSSIGVLVGLIFVFWFPIADGILAVLIGLYIIKESWEMGKETTDQLIGVNDEEAEKEIREILKARGVSWSDLKTRRIGGVAFAELTITLDSELKVEEAEKITEKLQAELKDKVEQLKYVVVQVKSHNYATGSYEGFWGQWRRWRRGWQKEKQELQLKEKQGYRIMIPVQGSRIFSDFGAPEYLLVDKQNGQVVQIQTIANPYFDQERGRGMRVLKAAEPDELIVAFIGGEAEEKVKAMDIKISKVDKDFKVEEYKKEV